MLPQRLPLQRANARLAPRWANLLSRLRRLDYCCYCSVVVALAFVGLAVASSAGLNPAANIASFDPSVRSQVRLSIRVFCKDLILLPNFIVSAVGRCPSTYPVDLVSYLSTLIRWVEIGCILRPVFQIHRFKFFHRNRTIVISRRAVVAEIPVFPHIGDDDFHPLIHMR